MQRWNNPVNSALKISVIRLFDADIALRVHRSLQRRTMNGMMSPDFELQLQSHFDANRPTAED